MMQPRTKTNMLVHKAIMGFCTITCPRLVHYTKLISSHINQARHDQALAIFHHIQTSLAMPLDPHVFSLILKSCTAINHPQLGVAIHAYVTKVSFISNPFIASTLIDFYGKCASLSIARQVFDEIPNRNDVVWNTMISLYTHSNDVASALQLFDVMDIMPNESIFNSIIAGLARLDGGSFEAIAFYRRMHRLGLKPRLITLLSLLPASVGVAALNLIKEIHGYAIRNGIDPHPQLSSGLVEAYWRCGCLFNAHSIFWSMKEKDVVAWSNIISAYALHGDAKSALEMLHQMELAHVKPDDITFLVVLKACSHAGLADEASYYFKRMCECYDIEANSDHYSCLIDVLSRAGRLYEAYEVIREMPVKVTAKAWGALLGACRTYGEVELAEIAGRALSEVEPDNAANYVLLAKIYASVGRHEEAERMRRKMNERGVQAAIGSSWVLDSE
ncbi:putative pentatricopeptide repeat-containing protein At1g03510 [Prosopis cineraria]|uniref:putative pentatricopeptide repeat-containing protein At1g03510 n=1 Tax=Prosopis cineraria TaxID=364024 RepID=UPI00241066F6|nr:putative pentatricopeptide repeat-containing protein At1g03510 [Prosopis cineraria]XP_054822832.1 putative pentatricopeptide repeat-containing protein At1g03510 [Prosopis cineraria]